MYQWGSIEGMYVKIDSSQKCIFQSFHHHAKKMWKVGPYSREGRIQSQTARQARTTVWNINQTYLTIDRSLHLISIRKHKHHKGLHDHAYQHPW